MLKTQKQVKLRDHNKVFFFGLVGGGKSTIINALLRDNVLPTGMGATTNCYCCVTGSVEPEASLRLPSSSDRHSVKEVHELAHAGNRHHLHPNSMLTILWPKPKCRLFTGEMELIDTPGVGRSVEIDRYILEYVTCANDVLVYTCNVMRILHQTEKDLIKQAVAENSIQTIFILNNFWDEVGDKGPAHTEVMKSSIMDEELQFLCEELAVTVDKKTASERIFFVSGKEAFSVKKQLQSGVAMEAMEDVGYGLKRGWKNRYHEFEKFEDAINELNN